MSSMSLIQILISFIIFILFFQCFRNKIKVDEIITVNENDIIKQPIY